MSKKFILHGMGIGKRRLKGLMWAVVLLCYSLLPNPLYARAEMCSEIDYDIITTAAGTYHVLCIKEDGTVVGTGGGWYGQLNVSDWTKIKVSARLK